MASGTPLVTPNRESKVEGGEVLSVPASLASYQISPAEYLAQNKGAVDHLVAAAVVIVPAQGSDEGDSDRTLVLQRSRHDYAGLTWEVPGGSCELDDASILSAACRELWEEVSVSLDYIPVIPCLTL